MSHLPAPPLFSVPAVTGLNYLLPPSLPDQRSLLNPGCPGSACSLVCLQSVLPHSHQRALVST